MLLLFSTEALAKQGPKKTKQRLTRARALAVEKQTQPSKKRGATLLFFPLSFAFSSAFPRANLKRAERRVARPRLLPFLPSPPPPSNLDLFPPQPSQPTSSLFPLFLSRPRPLFLSLQLPQGAAAPRKVLTSGKDIKATQFTIGLSSKKGKTVSIGFTKSNELFVGRMAMLGIASSIIGEVLTGKGALAQLGFETGLPIFDLDGLILAVIGFNLIAALLPAKGKFIPDDEELLERPAGALQSSKVSLATPGAFFGIKGFGFTKENELFVGRMAQLGFAASLIGEGITGKGFLGQLGFETGIPLIDVDFFLAVSIAFTLFAAINEGSGKFVDEDE